MTTSLTKLVPNSSPRADRRDELRHWQADLTAAWQGGQRLLIEELRPSIDPKSLSSDDYLLLIECEISVRREVGDRPVHAEYALRYPALAKAMMRFFQAEITQIVKAAASTKAGTSTTTPTSHVPGFQLIAMIGRGGMGVVYKARQIGLNRLVALKMVLAGRYADDDERARFRREAEAVGALDHPNIVRVYDVGEHEGTPFISLEYVNGGTLADRLRQGPLNARDAAYLAESIARGAGKPIDMGLFTAILSPLISC